MEAGKPITITLSNNNALDKPMFRQYEVVKHNQCFLWNTHWSMVREDAKPDAAGSCTVNLRRLNTSKWNFIAKIQIRIFQRLLQEPKNPHP